jgi:hypothetical protein
MQPLKNFSEFYGARKYMLTRAISWAQIIHAFLFAILATWSAHLILLGLIIVIILGKEYSLCSFLQWSVTSSPLVPNIFKHPQSVFTPTISDQVSCPYKTADKIIVLYILVFTCLTRLNGITTRIPFPLNFLVKIMICYDHSQIF